MPGPTQIPAKAAATNAVYNLVAEAVIDDLNTKLSSLQRVDFLPVANQAALLALFNGKQGWVASLVPQNQAGAGGVGTTTTQVVYLQVK